MKIKLKLSDDYLTDNIESIYSRLDKLYDYYSKKFKEVSLLRETIKKGGFYTTENLFHIEELEENLSKKDLPF